MHAGRTLNPVTDTCRENPEPCTAKGYGVWDFSCCRAEASSPAGTTYEVEADGAFIASELC